MHKPFVKEKSLFFCDTCNHYVFQGERIYLNDNPLLNMSNYLPFEKAPSRIIENDFVIINLYEEDSIIFVGWKRQIVLEERKMSLLQALDLTNHYQVKNWIISDQNIYYLSSEEENWIFSDWVKIASRSSLGKNFHCFSGKL